MRRTIARSQAQRGGARVSPRAVCSGALRPAILWLAAGALACGDEDPIYISRTGLIDAAIAPDGGAGESGALDTERDAGIDEGGESGSRAPTVMTPSGRLEGKRDGTTAGFLGIPYAKPPVGALRFAPPEPAEPWSGTRLAKEFGPSCPQGEGVLSAPGPKSEDCLTLNVFTPTGLPDKLPVMVWIHGGGFIAAGSNQYDGARLASEGVVVVTLNYRLGPLGFLSHPALDAVRTVPSGNDGLRDQVLALSWVREHIASFGGDPDNITVFGESTGAISACLHFASPSSRSLARRFILQSGSCTTSFLISTKQAADAVGEELARAFCAGEADPIACLRARDPLALATWDETRGIAGAGWTPVINPADPLLPEPAAALMATGTRAPDAALIVGTNANEWGLFATLLGSDLSTKAKVEALIDAQFGAAAASVKKLYTDMETDGTARAAYLRLMTASSFRCPSRALARLAASKGVRTYLYSFEEGLAFHVSEIPYVFGNPSAPLGVTQLEPLREIIQGYWTAFAETGYPNVAGQVVWPRYESASDAHLALKTIPTPGSMLWKSDCDLWDGIAQ